MTSIPTTGGTMTTTTPQNPQIKPLCAECGHPWSCHVVTERGADCMGPHRMGCDCPGWNPQAVPSPAPTPPAERCGARPNPANHGHGIFECEEPKGHAGPHRSGLNGWTDIPGYGPSLAAPYPWVANPKSAQGDPRALPAEVPDLIDRLVSASEALALADTVGFGGTMEEHARAKARWEKETRKQREARAALEAAILSALSAPSAAPRDPAPAVRSEEALRAKVEALAEEWERSAKGDPPNDWDIGFNDALRVAAGDLRSALSSPVGEDARAKAIEEAVAAWCVTCDSAAGQGCPDRHDVRTEPADGRSTDADHSGCATCEEDDRRVSQATAGALRDLLAAREVPCVFVPGQPDPPHAPRCPRCGYTWRDVQEQMDHHLCPGPGPSGPNTYLHPDLAAPSPASSSTEKEK